MSKNSSEQAKMDRELTRQADQQIPETQSAIERAKEQIRKNQELLDRLKAKSDEKARKEDGEGKKA